MASYIATWVGPPSNSAQQDDVPEVAEAATPFESWLDWLEEARDAIAEGEGDPDDADTLLAVILEHVVGGGPDAIGRRDGRIEEVLREAQASNGKITAALRQQCAARETRKIESAALAKRLDGMTDAIGSLARENAELKTKLSACEQNLAQATDMLEKEIARERSLRRLLDAQRSRPHTQRIASELAKRHAAKVLESTTKKETEEAA
jgi:hypothetical protein